MREELTGTFFTMDLDRARRALAQVPWVRNVALRRQWPHRLEVEVEEHAPLARWNDASLVNARGEVFSAEWKDDLPQFEGQEGRAAEMAAQYRAWSARLQPLALAVRTLQPVAARRLADPGAPDRRGALAWNSAATSRTRASRASSRRSRGRWARWRGPARASITWTCAIATDSPRAYRSSGKRRASRPPEERPRDNAW